YDDSTLNVHYSYDEKSALVGINDTSGSTTFVYDKENLLKKTHTIVDQHFVQTYTYTPTDKIATMTYPSGKQISYHYNAKNEIDTILLDGTPLIEHIDMRNGKLFGYDYPDGTQHTRTYDMDERVASIGYPSFEESVVYDATSNIVSMKMGEQRYIYSFDAIDRVTVFDKNDTTEQQFGYDANGNRITLADALGGMTRYYYAVGSNILNQVKSDTAPAINYSYDDMGNVIDDGNHTYSYDGRNRLVGVDDTIFYQYNYANQRVSKSVDGVKTYFVYDGHKLLGEYDEEGKMLREYIYLNDTPQ
ncbi:MAG: RHS repeat protein, partial [Epsilonproteobacteria bacterium]|nr:RHS repeat protein [Campylobacterota bacterium]